MKSLAQPTVRLLLAAVMSTAASIGLLAQAQRRDRPQSTTANASTTAIMVDVTVRDKKGHPVTDLAPGDFDLFEEGVLQEVASFKRISRGVGFAIVRQEGAGPEPRFSAPETVVDPLAGTGVLALVFDRLSPEARTLAHKAAASYVKENVLQGDHVGVFSIDVELRSIQPYTSDVSAV